MDEFTFEDIKNMSDEEVRALNRKLGIRALKQFALVQALKWTAIIGSIYIAKKLLEASIDDENN